MLGDIGKLNFSRAETTTVGVRGGAHDTNPPCPRTHLAGPHGTCCRVRAKVLQSQIDMQRRGVVETV